MTPTPGTTYVSACGRIRLRVETVTPPDRYGFFLVETSDPADPDFGGGEVTMEEWEEACEHFGLSPEGPKQ